MPIPHIMTELPSPKHNHTISIVVRYGVIRISRYSKPPCNSTNPNVITLMKILVGRLFSINALNMMSRTVLILVGENTRAIGRRSSEMTLLLLMV